MRHYATVSILLAAYSHAAAQTVTLQAPLHSSGSSFYERTGFHWGINIPGSSSVRGLTASGQPTSDGSIPIRFGRSNGALPPFGGFNPSADSTLGLAWGNRDGGGGFFNLALAQGSRRVSSMVAPSLTVTDGYPGAIFDGQVRPFVTGVMPVVGGQGFRPAPPVVISPLQSRLSRLRESGSPPTTAAADQRVTETAQRNAVQLAQPKHSSAAQGDVSLRAIRGRRPEIGAESQLKALMVKAEQAEDDGRLYAARQYLRQAARHAPAEQQAHISSELARLSEQIRSAQTDR